MARMSGSVARTRSSSAPTTILKSSYSGAWRALSRGTVYLLSGVSLFFSISVFRRLLLSAVSGIPFSWRFPQSQSFGNFRRFPLSAFRFLGLSAYFFWLSGSLPFCSASSGASCLASAFVSAFFFKRMRPDDSVAHSASTRLLGTGFRSTCLSHFFRPPHLIDVPCRASQPPPPSVQCPPVGAFDTHSGAFCTSIL